MRLAVLGSTRGTNLIALIAAIKKGDLAASIELVISNKAEAGILEKAKANSLACLYLCSKGFNREDYDRKLSNILIQKKIDLLILIGYMRILSPSFVRQWQNKIINVHPSLLPAYGGMMDLAVHTAVIKAKEQFSGCTVHYVTEKVDAGPILWQMRCPVFADDTPEQLKKRVQALEGSALVMAIKKHKEKNNEYATRLCFDGLEV